MHPAIAAALPDIPGLLSPIKAGRINAPLRDMADFLIRDATPEDAAALAPLLDALGYPADSAVIRERLARLRAEDSTARVLLAVRGVQVLGFATVHATPVLHRPSAVGRITALAVLPGHHGHGIGRGLVQAAEVHFANIGLFRVEVTSGPTHQQAHAFYRRLGYEDQGVRFARLLQGSGARGS